MRTIIDLPRDQIDALARICRREGISRAEAIRRAIRDWIAETRHREWKDAVQENAGIWPRDGRDAREFVREIREEWSHRDRRLGL